MYETFFGMIGYLMIWMFPESTDSQELMPIYGLPLVSVNTFIYMAIWVVLIIKYVNSLSSCLKDMFSNVQLVD